MLGLSLFGLFHTVLGVVALASGVGSLALQKEISTRTTAGRVYVVVTVLVAGTGLAIFHRGGFGVPHGVAIATLSAIAVGLVAERTHVFRGLSRYVMTFSFSATLLFHLMPTVAEGLSRLPPGAPVAAGPDDPLVKNIIGVLSVLFIIGVTLQFVSVREQRKRAST
jgi:hypothetical protein